MPTFNQVLVAADFDQTLDANDNIEAFTPNTGSPKPFKASRAGMVYFAVTGREHSEGEARFHPNYAQSFAGSKQVVYIQPACHPDSYVWLVANYRGQVTCEVSLDGTSYSTWNAFLRFEKASSSARIGWWEVRWIFQLIEEIV
jgi:hypothetical protein